MRTDRLLESLLPRELKDNKIRAPKPVPGLREATVSVGLSLTISWGELHINLQVYGSPSSKRIVGYQMGGVNRGG